MVYLDSIGWLFKQLRGKMPYVSGERLTITCSAAAGLTIAAILAHGQVAPAPWNAHPPAHTSPAPKQSVERVFPM